MKSATRSATRRGRPKGRSNASSELRSFGPLGDLIRSNRLARGLGLLDVARACGCSVQFVSNIEHGRAPLPWDKVPQLATVLKVSAEELQAANLAIRSDFKSFLTVSRSKKSAKPASAPKGGATAMAIAASIAAKDDQLRSIIEKYQAAGLDARKKFVRAALQMLAN